ncbi:hypothetical protein B425_2046 [Bacillus amyloliquefaciens]|nr:hypothetical protein B425_2046 [Bacillus amyloliquefaciens]
MELDLDALECELELDCDDAAVFVEPVFSLFVELEVFPDDSCLLPLFSSVTLFELLLC